MNFLKLFLRQVKEDKPFRGPDYFKKDNFEYFNESQGDINDFVGNEKIFFNKKEVYKLNYHGGLCS